MGKRAGSDGLFSCWLQSADGWKMMWNIEPCYATGDLWKVELLCRRQQEEIHVWNGSSLVRDRERDEYWRLVTCCCCCCETSPRIGEGKWRRLKRGATHLFGFYGLVETTWEGLPLLLACLYWICSCWNTHLDNYANKARTHAKHLDAIFLPPNRCMYTIEINCSFSSNSSPLAFSGKESNKDHVRLPDSPRL